MSITTDIKILSDSPIKIFVNKTCLILKTKQINLPPLYTFSELMYLFNNEFPNVMPSEEDYKSSTFYKKCVLGTHTYF